MQKRIEYRRGPMVERAASQRKKITYRWAQGYHRIQDGKPLYPAMTRDECRLDAENEGAKAKYTEPK